MDNKRNNMNDKSQIDEIKFNAENLWKEESFTDLEVGSIRKLSPINSDGSDDTSRKPTFTATTNIMTPNGALPLSGEIKASTLDEAILNFSDAINDALKKLQDDMVKMQQEQANKIVTPDDLRGNKDLII
tara:strand:+ start:470 stop:859 length:390 start_codon:yes stop_codon:yes gene_type:complete